VPVAPVLLHGHVPNADDEKLFDHLIEEFGDGGRSSVEFLRTAEAYLEAPDPTTHPRVAETIAYNTREALKRILDTVETPPGGTLGSASRSVVAARERYLIARGLPGADEAGALEDLLRAIDELEEGRNQEGIHQRRLIAVVVNRTGAVPLSAASNPISEYQELIERLNRIVHEHGSLDEVRGAFEQAIALIRRLFSPPDVRMAELDALAALAAPTTADADRLLSLVSAPSHLDYFFRSAVSPSWLELLSDSEALTPPDGQANWPVFRAVEKLGQTHADEIAAWLDHAYDKWGSSATRAWYLARAAIDLGSTGHRVMLRALRDYPTEGSVNFVAAWALEQVDADDRVVEAVADLALNALNDFSVTGHLKTLIDKLSTGVNADNWLDRVRLLVFKIRAVPEEDAGRRITLYERGGSIAEPVDAYDDRRFAVLLGGLTEVLTRAVGLGVSVDDLLESITDVPEDVRARLRPWILSQGPDFSASRLISEVADFIAKRHPCGDDLALIDRVVEQSEEVEYVGPWKAALGAAPTPEEIGPALAEHAVPDEWFARRKWSVLLPAPCTNEWTKAGALMAAAYGPATREALEKRSDRVEFSSGRSPLRDEELKGLAPGDAAVMIAEWKPDPSEWLVSARELARTLEQLVKDDPEAWTESPLDMVSSLRHPTYIGHYFRALAQVESGLGARADDLVEAIVFCRSHPWQPDVIGSDDFDYDPDWRHVDAAGVDLIKKLANSDAGFGDRIEQAWAVALESAADRSATSSLLSERDPLETAINRPCTSALEAVFALMGYEFRSSGTVRAEALELLDNALGLPGWDGVEHRAVIAPRLGFLLHIAHDWVTARQELLFGSSSPSGLGQQTVDLAVKWGRPQPWVLEHTRDQVIDAAARDVENAMSTLLIGMLWDVPGYDVESVVDQLVSRRSDLLSAAGEALGRLLRHDDVEPKHVERGVEFWRAVVSRNDANAMSGFGWWAEVKALDRERWEALTLASAELAHGRLEWAHEVAKRAADESITEAGLAILNELVRGQVDEWDRLQVMQTALTALSTAAEVHRESEPFGRLRTSVIERGFFDARDV
jgi:hypothetical protein